MFYNTTNIDFYFNFGTYKQTGMKYDIQKNIVFSTLNIVLL